MYRTPISEGFRAIRDRTMLEISFEPTTVLGLLVRLSLFEFALAFPTTGCIVFSTRFCSGGGYTQPITTSQR